MPRVLICDDCRVPQAKQSGFRESQWENPRPACNSCATNRAWTLFAADMAVCPNAQVVHNHGVIERPAPAVVPPEASALAPPLQWVRAAAKKMQAAPASIEDDKATTELAATYVDLDVVPCFVAPLSEKCADQVRNDVEAVACLQSTSLLLHIFEHGDREAILQSLDAFRLTVDDQSSTTATILTDLLCKQSETMDLRGAETQSLLKQHLYLTVLTLVGLVVHRSCAMPNGGLSTHI
ncbi:hypothetical protein SDRG_08220 [Saprolegnia diclina VS20]|uniref:Uncharacterized protein n=1 Tax=Saprolegnia diclina (strain VS20) TaxID=1156394 RepID=T0RUI7_SAPDV|nr:hypothetical protein SDRG_08220 [Saprolegnia diclina VS20]EQC34002.1 hypothetical protein SDRG_08220 [Saprolegnia diclina VS20]|eukprot:XP_008612314.1 hypothetical protein SDRG_08220 [Saprolegnia diclina VS20]